MRACPTRPSGRTRWASSATRRSSITRVRGRKTPASRTGCSSSKGGRNTTSPPPPTPKARPPPRNTPPRASPPRAWPAFWTLGTNIPKIGWPRCGEIDVMEFVGHTPDKVHATVHYAQGGKHASQGGKLTVARPWEGFHVYVVEWQADRMDFFFDETKYFTFKTPSAGDGAGAFEQGQYLLVNLALGGSWGGPIDDAALPQRYLIDYVRVYQRPAAATRPGEPQVQP
ncbi:MAG: glycoside hydrolase family 16 protein [Planctomycetota bacterium]|nr:glycoside hydrolase family 16 protein [Planctomycetota bacterium]